MIIGHKQLTNVSKYDVGPLVPLKQRGLTSGPGCYALSAVLERAH